MAGEGQGAAGSQADPAAQPQAGSGSAQAAGQSSSQADDAGQGTENLDPAALAKELREARNEAARYRREARTLTEAAEKAAQASLPEQERKEKRLAELEAKDVEHERTRKEWATEKVVVQAAVRLGFKDPADAFALLDRSAVEYDENGAPTNVGKLLEKLAEDKTYLTGAPGRGSFDQGPRGKPNSGQTMDDLLRGASGH